MKKPAFTLVEVMVSVFIGALILTGISSLLSNSLKTSSKGSSHLTNVQAAAIFMRQLVKDLRRACDLSQMPENQDELSAKFDILQENEMGGLATSSIIYEIAPDKRGIVRKNVGPLEPESNSETHTFCRDLHVLNCGFRHINLVGGGKGVYVSLKIGTPPNGSEEFEIKRFILCRNHASNTFMFGW
ncbi:prepilin-type N-terminal cleavage/methylation domain-containing protein [bacterium]|nr:prepilin-type N-terminal cleavage/methylation domain-containing protein [bacterium]